MKTFFGGDLCPTRVTSPLYKQKATDILFEDVKSLFEGNDYNIVNLECALTESDNAIDKIGPALKGPIETADVLKELNVHCCSLSNNHTLDFGIQGIEDTFAALEARSIGYTGFGADYEDSRRDYILKKDNEKVALIAVCEHEYTYALHDRMGARPYDEYDTMDDIRRAKAENDRVIVIYHGGKEFCHYPSPRLRKLCRAMVKNGADVVLCQHSHCIGCYENYEGGHILYGQGNFHFVSPSKRDCWFCGLAVKYDTLTHEIEFIPLNVLSEGIEIAKGERAEEIMGDFYARNRQLQNDEWQKGWEDFCQSVAENYKNAVSKAFSPDATEQEKEMFPHYFGCEAHADVLREIYKTYNYKNCR
ncbi:MAG: CapA family protein [Clostridia bacterium]|nr:CapA family protein [Clostridia bacterium]